MADLHATFTLAIPQHLLGAVVVIRGDTTAHAAAAPVARPVAAPTTGRPVT